ncbi:MAG: hypothetical protein ACHRHE_04995 [Tepidisphaerales bacterium]
MTALLPSAWSNWSWMRWQPATDQWPDGYFEQTAGALAGEQFDRPQQGLSPTREAW